jgi:hypothetical protein
MPFDFRARIFRLEGPSKPRGRETERNTSADDYWAGTCVLHRNTKLYEAVVKTAVWTQIQRISCGQTAGQTHDTKTGNSNKSYENEKFKYLGRTPINQNC